MPHDSLPTTDPAATRDEPAPAASHEGQLASAPALPAALDKGADATEQRAQRQWLTGRAARSSSSVVGKTPGQLAWRQLKKNRLAMVGLWMLAFLYSLALLAQFIAPYDPQSQNPGGVKRSLGYHPPMKLRFRSAQGASQMRPFVYQTRRERTPNYSFAYLPDAAHPRSLAFFVRGDAYRLFGLIPSTIHLFGVQDGYFYPLGTDEYGRCYFSRLLYGSQISLSVGLIAISITFSLGMLVGGISGFYGGRADDILMRFCEVLMSVPDFYLLLALAAALPVDLDPFKSYLLIIVILSFVGWAGMARIVRGMVLSVREREYVEAARALGVPDLQIIVRHVLPSTFTYAIVAATMSVPGYILGEAGLSFLGLGIRDPMASWGNMLSAAQNLSVLIDRQWILAPGFMIFLTTLAFNFLGDGLRDALDPKSRR